MAGKINEFAKKSLLAGLGLAVITKEKAQAIAKLLVKKGKASEAEAEKVAKMILVNAKKGKKIVEEHMDKAVKNISEKINVPSRKEFEKLKKMVSEIKRKRK